MENLTHSLTKIFNSAFKNCGYSFDEQKQQNLGEVKYCTISGFGDFQCNDSLSLAKLFKQNPMEIAQKIVNYIRDNKLKIDEKNMIEKIEVVKPGFINIWLTNSFLAKYVQEYILSLDNQIKTTSPKNIVVDYGGANVAKPLHVGHLRSAIIGESIKRLLKFGGDNVIGDVHLGDWGLQMGMIIAEIKRTQPDLPFFNSNFVGEYPSNVITLKELETIYPQASKRAKEDDEFKEECRQATYQLQNGNAGYLALWKEFVNVSKTDLKKNYSSLNVYFDKWLGESDADKYCKPMIDEINKAGLSRESEGALIIDLAQPTDQAEMPPFMLIKTDGSILYSTTDLATIIQRSKDFNTNKNVYVVDNRQSLHFEQLKRAYEKTKKIINNNKNIEIVFAGFGTMNGTDGKPFKTRDGGVLKLQTLIEEVKQKAKEKINSRNDETSFTNEEKENIVNKVAISTLKFADLSNYRTKDYVFDIDKFCAFEGKTGPYLLYTVTRIKSLLNKQNVTVPQNFEVKITDKTEREIFITITEFYQTVKNAITDYAPNYLCDLSYRIATLFSSFYAEHNVLNETNLDKKYSWILISEYCLKILETLLDLLGIETLARM